jgi:hypothetical protein
MTSRSRSFSALVVSALSAVVATCILAGPALASSPSLGSITPRGGQRGTEAVIFFNGGRLTDAQEILFYSPGVTVTKLEVVNDGQVKVTVRIADDCRLGEHAMRVRTASGISELRTFYVGALPAVDEKEPNTDFAAPQKINLSVTVTGVADNEDVDYYSFDAKKGQRVTAEIEGMRLGTTVFDPYVAILDSKRFELSTSDDNALVWQDAVASVVIPEDGTYYVQVRESSYAGNGGCVYRLHVGTFPRPTGLVPAGGKIGDDVEVNFLGDAAGEFKQKVKLPTVIEQKFALFAQDAGGVSPSGNVFRLSEFGNVVETEPNENHDQATRGELPIAFNGVISKPGDVDHFRFAAKKGQVFDVHCYARRVRSPLDPVMTIFHAAGGGIVGNDDAVGPDSYFRFSVPEDKEYVISVSDHLGKGGPNYTYRIEFTAVQPRLSLNIPKVAIFSQERQTISVPRGNRYATLMVANRADFGGDLVLGADALPQGLTMSSEGMPANLNVIPVLFEAAPDAPVGGKLVDLSARHADPNQKISGGFEQTVELATGGPGQSVYWKCDVTRAAVAVTEEVPFKINIVEPKVPLVQNGSMNLKVVVERKPEYKAPITLIMPFNPPGVGSASSVTIPEGQNEALYPINANGGAQVRKWKIVILATATVGNGPVWVSSQLATLEIAPPYLAFAMEKNAVEQGKEAELFCKVQHTTPFDGSAKVRLVGLPNAATAPEMDITKETKEFAFKVTTAKESPAGTHKNLFCQVVITQNGEPVVHNVGGTELRIDVPLPPKPAVAAAPAAAPQPAAPAAPMPPAEKRLTRLEKLRLEQAEKEKAGAGAPAKP